MAADHERGIATTFVAGQFALLGAIIFAPTTGSWPRPGWLAISATSIAFASLALAAIAALRLGRGLTALPLPNEHAVLRTSGPYRFVRHPIYTGLIIFAVADVIGSASLWRAGAALLLVVLLNQKAKWEETRLIARFAEYRKYAAATGRFFPHPGRRA